MRIGSPELGIELSDDERRQVSQFNRLVCRGVDILGSQIKKNAQSIDKKLRDNSLEDAAIGLVAVCVWRQLKARASVGSLEGVDPAIQKIAEEIVLSLRRNMLLSLALGKVLKYDVSDCVIAAVAVESWPGVKAKLGINSQ